MFKTLISLTLLLVPLVTSATYPVEVAQTRDPQPPKIEEINPAADLSTSTLRTLGWYYANKSGLNLLELDAEQMNAFTEGMLRAMEGESAPTDIQEATQQLQRILGQAHRRAREALAQKHRALSRELQMGLERRAADPKSGLQVHNGIYYTVKGTAEADSPAETDSVRVEYKGKIAATGDVFEDTRGVVTLKLPQLFEGLRDAILLLQPGQYGTFYIPPDKAFGSLGTQNIPPDAYLLYELTLHSVN